MTGVRIEHVDDRSTTPTVGNVASSEIVLANGMQRVGKADLRYRRNYENGSTRSGKHNSTSIE